MFSASENWHKKEASYSHIITLFPIWFSRAACYQWKYAFFSCSRSGFISQLIFVILNVILGWLFSSIRWFEACVTMLFFSLYFAVSVLVFNQRWYVEFADVVWYNLIHCRMWLSSPLSYCKIFDLAIKKILFIIFFRFFCLIVENQDVFFTSWIDADSCRNVNLHLKWNIGKKNAHTNMESKRRCLVLHVSISIVEMGIIMHRGCSMCVVSCRYYNPPPHFHSSMFIYRVDLCFMCQTFLSHSQLIHRHWTNIKWQIINHIWIKKNKQLPKANIIWISTKNFLSPNFL